jgi:hypothetical protein
VKEIRKDSSLYKVAYGYAPERTRPRITSLCPFFWRLVFSSLVVWPVIGIEYFLFLFVGFWIGKKPTIMLGWSDRDYKWTSYKRWPSMMGFRILPLYAIGVPAWIWGCYSSGGVLTVTRLLLLTFGIIVICGILILAYFFVKDKLGSSEAFGIIKAYFKARKEEVCPLIRFVDSNDDSLATNSGFGRGIQE